MHGLPKYSKEEKERQTKMYEENVDYKEFLPNSITRSPKRKTFSNSYKTQRLGLYSSSSRRFSERSTRLTTAETPKANDKRDAF